MSYRRRLAGLLAAVLVMGIALPVAAASPDATAARMAADAAAFRDRFIVVWRGAPPAQLGVAGVESMQAANRPTRTIVEALPGRAAAVAARLRADPRVLAVVPDARLEPAAWPVDPPDDPFYLDQGNLAQMNVPAAWSVTTGDPSVVVAVIDSGVDVTHPDLAGRTIVAPRNEVWNGTDVSDWYGHGTYVAGLIAAEPDNFLGIAGIAPDTALMPIKIMDDDGWMSFSDLLDAVDWAREQGADIINMSLSGTLSAEQRNLAQPVFSAAREAGILMVASSGNDGIALRNYPASFYGVVSVGAVDGEDALADFSTTGKALDIVAPGVDLWSLVPDGGYENASGTSAASPEVAAIAALVWAARPDLDVEELEAVLRSSAADLGDPGWDPAFGDGRVDAAAALAAPVPDPIPNLEPPLPAPFLELTFVAPAEAVTQSGSSYLVELQSSGEIVEAYALMGGWPIRAGTCRYREDPEVRELDFALQMPLTGLRKGTCYHVYVLAIDDDGNFAEVESPVIRVVDPIVPEILRRRPAPGSRGVDRDVNVRIRFSEPVTGAVRLRNLETGLIVRVTSRFDRSTDTLVLDPVLRLYPRTAYRVEVTAKVQDRHGNPVGAEDWVFRTGRD